jgi:4-amino-4-deoxy-L-arabinose transferase-like glycosyltransferase
VATPGQANDTRPTHSLGTRLLLVAIVGLILRLAFSLAYWTDQPLTRDEREYLALARGLTTGQGFSYDPAVLGASNAGGGVDPFGRAPGYPVFLAAVGGGRTIPSSVPVGVKIAQSVIGVLGVLVASMIAKRLAGSRAAIATAIVGTIYLPLVWVSAYALSEAVAWPLTLVAVWLFDRAVESRDAKALPFFGTGVVFGMLTLIRPASIFFLLLAGLWLLWKRRMAAAGWLTVGALLMVAPWTIRNVERYGRLVFIASEGGVTFWTGNHPRAIGEGDLAANLPLKLDRERLRALHPGLSEEQMEPIYYREAFQWIRTHPLDWLRLEARKLFYFVVPVGPSYRVHSTRYAVATFVSYIVILPLAVVGVLLLREARRRSPGLWLLAGSAMLMSLVFFPQDRFRLSTIDPVLIVCAGAVRGSARDASS